jgi:hypothetical protein
LHGALPEKVVTAIQEHLTPTQVHAVVHADLLRYIDFDKYQKVGNGGAPLRSCLKDFPTLDSYWVEQRFYGGPGVLRHDVEDDWNKLSQRWDEEIQRILP